MSFKSDKTPEIENDLLGRHLIACEIEKAISSFSKKNKDGICISITGEWGCGKSTLLKYLKNELINNSSEHYSIIEFNPWMFSNNEGIKEAFLTELAVSLKEFDTKAIKVSEKMNKLIRAFNWVKYVSSTVGNIQDGLEKFTDVISEKLTVQETKNEIELAIRKRKKKLVVFIDDIDRLMPDQITEVFQTISLVTNFSNIIYIVAFDRNIVVKALDKAFNGNGLDYLEKIIQVDYEIPTILDEKLEQFFKNGIFDISRKYNISFDEYGIHSLWNYYGLKEYFTTIRDFKRFFNSISFRLPSIAEDINTVDFIGLEAIRLFDYPSYIYFYQSYRINYRKRELPDAGLSLIQFEHLKQTAGEIIKSWALKSLSSSYRNDNSYCRLLDPDYFDRYFSLLRSGNDMSEKDLRELVLRPNVRQGILNQVLQNNRIDNLLKRLKEPVFVTKYPNYEFTLISELIYFFDKNPHIFSQVADSVSDMLIHLICSHKNKKEFLQLFFKEFSKHTTPVSIVNIYFFFFIRLFIKENRQFTSRYQEFDEYYKQNYEFLEKQIRPVLEDASRVLLNTNYTTTCPFIVELYLIICAELFSDKYPQLIEEVLRNTDFVFYMADKFLWLDDNTFKVIRTQFTYKDLLLPGDFFNKFYSIIEETPNDYLSERNKSVKAYYMKLDKKKYPFTVN